MSSETAEVLLHGLNTAQQALSSSKLSGEQMLDTCRVVVAGLWASCCPPRDETNNKANKDLHRTILESLRADLEAHHREQLVAGRVDADGNTTHITLLICVAELIMKREHGPTEWLASFAEEVVLPVVRTSPALCTATRLTKVFATGLADAAEDQVVAVASLLVEGMLFACLFVSLLMPASLLILLTR
jgi:hypothetical protein